MIGKRDRSVLVVGDAFAFKAELVDGGKEFPVAGICTGLFQDLMGLDRSVFKNFGGNAGLKLGTLDTGGVGILNKELGGVGGANATANMGMDGRHDAVDIAHVAAAGAPGICHLDLLRGKEQSADLGINIPHKKIILPGGVAVGIVKGDGTAHGSRRACKGTVYLLVGCDNGLRGSAADIAFHNDLVGNCVDGITANEGHCKELVMGSIGIVTALNPGLGYENSAKIAKRALKENRSVYDLVLEEGLLSKEELDELLRPENMISPHKMPTKRYR